MRNNVVKGEVVDGYVWSLAAIFGSGPKLTILCHGCDSYYKDRAAPAEVMTAVCPHCGALNRLDVIIDR